MSNNMDERLRDLLCDQAVFGLDDTEQKELAGFELTAESEIDARSLEFTAAAISMIGVDRNEQMPGHLQARILADAAKYLPAAQAETVEENFFTAPRREVPVEKGTSGSFWNWAGWAVAAAASVALAINLYISRPGIEIADGPRPTPTVEQKLLPNQMRDRLIASAADLKRAEVAKGNVKEIGAVSGDIVWSDERQEGYMRLRGLPANDVDKETYQLWIFEDGNLEAHPKDGGVFDVTADGEVIIPIDAKLKVKEPKVFAITIEKPGGVVVSSREKIAVLAKSET
jgi:anti-sigma-K factor RskA